MKSEELTGLWWLPNDPEVQVAGTLSIFEDGSVQLRLIGSLIDFNKLQQITTVPAIVGSGSGENVTLFSSRSTGSRASFPGTITMELRPELTVVGAHLESRDELRILTAFAEFDHMYRWVGESGLKERLRVVKDIGVIGLTYDYEKPAAIEANLGSRKIGWHFGYQSSRPSEQALSFVESVSVEVEPILPVGFDELLEQHITPLQNFVTLGVGEFAQLRALRVILDAPGRDEKKNRPVRLIFEPSYYREIPKPIDPERMLFTLGKIRDRLADILGRWFDQLETLRPVVNLYFATVANRRMYLEHRFLSLVQAAETYHRKTNLRTIAPHQAFSDVRRSLCQVIDGAPDLKPADRQMFKSKLAYLNEVPLKERLRELLAEHQYAFAIADGVLEDLARKVGDTRNFLTHYDPSLQCRAAHGIELLRLGDKVQMLMELCFLRDLGFTEPDLAAFARLHARNDRL
jgi:hypothetical protein